MSRLDQEFAFYGLTLKDLLAAGKEIHWRCAGPPGDLRAGACAGGSPFMSRELGCLPSCALTPSRAEVCCRTKLGPSTQHPLQRVWCGRRDVPAGRQKGDHR